MQTCIRPPIESAETRELLLSVILILGDRELTADKLYHNVKLVTILTRQNHNPQRVSELIVILVPAQSWLHPELS